MLIRNEQFNKRKYDRIFVPAYEKIDEMLRTEEGKQAILNNRLGDTLEQKMKLKFMEDEENVGTAVEVGSTACTVLIAERKIYCANAGDSRAIMGLKDGGCIELSHDHKPDNETETKRIYAARGKVKAGRVHQPPTVFNTNGAISVSRAIGDLGFKQDEDLDPSQQLITCHPDVSVNALDNKVAFILIACDGIWDCLSSD